MPCTASRIYGRADRAFNFYIMSKKNKEDIVPETSLLGSLLGKGESTKDLSSPDEGTSMELLLELIKNSKVNSSEFYALLQTYLQRGFDLDARDYNSVTSQVERLMAAGMSRTQALLTATAGEAVPTQVGDLATAASNDANLDVAKTQFAVQTAFGAIGSFANFFAGNYGAIVTMRGDQLVQDVGQEIYSWLPRGIEVPKEARADAESFKRWCLGMLHDENGQTIEPPKEARDLIHSDSWQRMASRPSGWLAFERYFNANYSTRGFHEDLEDAKRFRQLQTLSVINSRMQNFMNMPQLYDTTLELAFEQLQGLNVSVSEGGVSGTIVVGNTHFNVSDDVSSTSLIYEGDDVSTSAQGYFLNPDGTLRSDAPSQLRLLASQLSSDMATMSMLTDKNYILQVRKNLLANEQLKGIMIEADKVVQGYRRDQLTKASENASHPSNAFVEMLQNLLTNYMLMTGGRSFIDDATGAVGFGVNTFFKGKSLVK